MQVFGLRRQVYQAARLASRLAARPQDSEATRHRRQPRWPAATLRALERLRRDFPFPVQAIQVDGGSEFMAAFETACQAKAIQLFVLPPKSPELNGAVERANGAWRYEFYACYDLPHQLAHLNRLIDSFAHLYNHYRPHGALRGLTPAAYLHSLMPPETSLSQQP